MDPVTAVVVAAVISAIGTVAAAWVQGRAQRRTGRGGQQAAGPADLASAEGTSAVTSCELRSNDGR